MLIEYPFANKALVNFNMLSSLMHNRVRVCSKIGEIATKNYWGEPRRNQCSRRMS